MEEGSGFFWKYCKRVSENTVIILRSGDIITGSVSYTHLKEGTADRKYGCSADDLYAVDFCHCLLYTSA